VTREQPAEVRKSPCASCPYRRSVDSGIWDASEYAKLEQYDGEAHEQTRYTVFFCHQTGEEVCAGWLGHRDPVELIAARVGVMQGTIAPDAMEFTTDVPLFDSGHEAAEHGRRDLENPSEHARQTMSKITRKRGL
jgi:hypothetical protein